MYFLLLSIPSKSVTNDLLNNKTHKTLKKDSPTPGAAKTSKVRATGLKK